MPLNASDAPPIYVLGLGLPIPGDSSVSPDLERHPLVTGADVLIGGRALLDGLAHLPAEKLIVDAHVAALYDRIAANRLAGKTQVALCSGDPLFFGLGARLAERFGREAVRIVPGISSLQGAAALLGLPWERVSAVSLHGRASRLPLAHALMQDGPVFALADAVNTPASVAAWMAERGCEHYAVHVLEGLYHTETGEVRTKHHVRLTVAEAASWRTEAKTPPLTALFLAPQGPAPARPFGLADDQLLREKNLLTKGPIRAASLAALGVMPESVVWDLGAGSGSVSLEAARLTHRGQVFAVERKAERVAHIVANRKRFAALNLEIVQGDMPACLPVNGASAKDAEDGPLPCPDRIFIGGGLGGDAERTREILTRSWQALRPGGRLLADCVLLSSLERSRTVLLELGAKLSVTCLHASTSNVLADDMRLEALNPVFLVLGEKDNT